MSVKLVHTHERIFGPQLIATAITSFMYGLAVLLTGYYFKTKSSKDPLYIQLLLGAMLVPATLQIVFTTHQSYFDLIINIESVQRDLRGRELTFSVPGKFICVYVTTFLAQCFFAVHIWTIASRVSSRLRFFVIPVVLTALLQLVAGSIQAHLQVTSPTFRILGSTGPILVPVTAIQASATAGCDLIITTALCLIYLKYSGSAFFESGMPIAITKLAVFAIHRAAATSICAILSILLYYLQSGSNRFVIPCLMTGQLYLISVVSVLLSDESLRGTSKNQDKSETGSITKECSLVASV
ncbi:hypothetical protein FA15DRAFT_706743 [Coprinopsis marcescibilis]|uniref:DUF6534 domain-containing protein n=1 Tax=Coprinopsis marcescibilis TaxID=230819 RepID=A0A5C3KP45_COPMA|nr:hypothetical protein FA15DRAFT_706743 [Coprinopsis marcescibilis]